jgi:hypothetical protein
MRGELESCLDRSAFLRAGWIYIRRSEPSCGDYMTKFQIRPPATPKMLRMGNRLE